MRCKIDSRRREAVFKLTKIKREKRQQGRERDGGKEVLETCALNITHKKVTNV